jgi:gliding motility-associated-like protein
MTFYEFWLRPNSIFKQLKMNEDKNALLNSENYKQMRFMPSPWYSLILLIFISLNVSGQRCNNPPVVTLSSHSGSTCDVIPVTVTGNTFGGSATAVTITDDGNGTVTPSSSSSSPFSFTYTPTRRDAGKNVTITVTTNNPQGSPCRTDRETYVLTISSTISVPVIETVIQPTCTVSTGSVGLTGLPSSGTWTVTVSPGGMTQEGTGSFATISHLPSGAYTFSVSVSAVCFSGESDPVEILDQPLIPTPPLPGMITPPTCAVATGSVTLVGLPISGMWTVTQYPGTLTTPGSGPSTIIAGLSPGIYYFTVTNQAGCISMLSVSVIIPDPPPVPSAPVIGSITQPTIQVSTGSVTLTGLPIFGTWTLTRFPGSVTTIGTGQGTSISGLAVGSYTFKVTNSYGCTSPASEEVIIALPVAPEVIVTDPLAVCSPATVDLTVPGITAGSTDGLTYTYWLDVEATIPLSIPSAVSQGTYYIKGTALSGFFDIKPVNVTVEQKPVSIAGPDQVLAFQFSTILDAELGTNESGIWRADSGNFVFSDVTDPKSTVSNLSNGINTLLWIVSNATCPADTGKVTITVGDVVIPSLITPNGDKRNEYFIVSGLETLGKAELVVFDRRGVLIFRDSDYENKWNGVDYNDNPVINDTYYYILRTSKGKSYSGYVIIRR